MRTTTWRSRCGVDRLIETATALIGRGTTVLSGHSGARYPADVTVEINGAGAVVTGAGAGRAAAGLARARPRLLRGDRVGGRAAHHAGYGHLLGDQARRRVLRRVARRHLRAPRPGGALHLPAGGADEHAGSVRRGREG